MIIILHGYIWLNILYLPITDNMCNKYENADRYGNENILGKVFDIKKETLRFSVDAIVSWALLAKPFTSWLYTSRKDRIELQNKITDYIVWWNLNSKRDPKLEEEIRKLSKYDQKLKYLVDNSDKPLNVNLRVISCKEREKSKQTNQPKNEDSESLLGKWWDWLKDKVKWLISHLVNLTDVPEKIWWVIWDVLTRAEKLIWQTYVRGTMDCSMFLSKIFCAWQWIKEQRLGTTQYFSKYPKVASKDIRCWDVIYQASPAHVELIVSKPYVENGATYVTTIWSSTDKYNVDPMFDADWNPIKEKTWVWYRKRKIAPNPRHPYTYHRPPYEEWEKKRA